MDNRFKFTDLKITHDAPKLRKKSGKAQFIIWDSIVAGLGGKIGATGTTFFVRARGPNKKEKTVSIGRHGSTLTVKLVRVEAARLIDEIKAGITATPTVTGKGITLREALERKTAKMDEPSARDYTCRIELHLKDWLDLNLGKITEDMVETRFEKIVKSGKLHTANKTIKLFGTVYRSVRRRHNLPPDPSAFMKDERLFIKIEKRRLPVEEMERDIGLIWNAIDAFPNVTLKNFGKLLALTGARPKQLRHLLWDDVDFEMNTFVMRDGSKTMKEAKLPMCDEARKVFVTMQSLRMQNKDARRDYVFPARRRGKAPNLSEYKTLTAAINADLDWHFVMYDFRRWMASRAVSLMSGAEARHLQTHAAKDAHGGYERPSANQLRDPLQAFENDFVEMVAP